MRKWKGSINWLIINNIMRTITQRATSLLLGLKYNYTPVSNYKLQNKVNPIIAITLGNSKQSLDLHFRVSLSSFSSLKMLSPGPPKTSNAFFSVLLPIMDMLCLLLAIRHIKSFLDHMSNLDILKLATALSLDPTLGMSPSNYPMIDLAFWAVSVNKIAAIVDSSLPLLLALSLISET